MRINLKIGENCSITKIDDNKLNVKLNLGLNNFNNSSFKTDTRIYIESIDFPVLKDSSSADILNGTINILTNAIEPDFNDFNSYQNINNPTPIFSSKINNLKYSSTGHDLYNFKINSSFMNNCNFTLEFIDIDSVNVFQKTVSQTLLLQNGIADDLTVGTGPITSSDDLDITITSGAIDSTRDGPAVGYTFPTFNVSLPTNSYTVTRGGNVLPTAGHSLLHNLAFIIVIQVSNLEVIGVVPGPLSSNRGGNGATFQVGDIITVNKSVFGASATDDLVFSVDSIGITRIEKQYNEQIVSLESFTDDKNDMLQNQKTYEQHLIDFKTSLQQLEDELYNTHIANYVIYLNRRIAINPSLTTGKSGPNKMARLQNGLSTIVNGDNTNLFYFFLHTASKSPFNPSSSATGDSVSTTKIEDSFGNQTSLKDATDFVNEKWNVYWSQFMLFDQQLNNFNWFYGNKFVNIGDRNFSGKGFPTANNIVWNSSGGNNFFETTEFNTNISETFTEVADPTKNGALDFNILMIRENNTNDLKVLISVEDFNASSYDDSTTNIGQKILINNTNSYAFGGVKTMVIKSGAVDGKRKTKNSFFHSNKGLYLVIPYTRAGGVGDGIATFQFPTNEKNIRGYDYNIGEEITIPASFFEADNALIPCDVDLVIEITDVYDKVVPLELEVINENIVNPFNTNDLGNKTIVYLDDAISTTQFLADNSYTNIPKTIININEPISIVDHIISSNQYDKSSISLNIYNELNEPDILKPNKSRFKQNNYQSTPLCPCRRYIR